METLIRKAQVAGQFYPDNADGINDLLDSLLIREKGKINYELAKYPILGAVLPHAGLMYSGYQAVHFFEILAASKQKFDTFVILHPLHQGGLIDYASDECNSWKTPLGEVHLDNEFIDCMDVFRSMEMHEYEHSAEVLLPFLQRYLRHSFRIVPIGISKQIPEVSNEIARKISKATNKTGRKICILASCDFSHYVHPDVGAKLDKKVTDKILKFDSAGVYNEVLKNQISVCGYGAVMALIDFSILNYSDLKVEIIAKGHSGEVHRSDKVVDYITLLFQTGNK